MNVEASVLDGLSRDLCRMKPWSGATQMSIYAACLAYLLVELEEDYFTRDTLDQRKIKIIIKIILLLCIKIWFTCMDDSLLSWSLYIVNFRVILHKLMQDYS